jgi:hypothetical protein
MSAGDAELLGYALPDHGALEFGKGPADLKHQATSPSASLDMSVAVTMTCRKNMSLIAI